FPFKFTQTRPRWKRRCARAASSRLAFEALEDRSVPAPLISIGDTSMVEGNAGIADMVYNIRLSTPAASEVFYSVSAVPASSTAVVLLDYSLTSFSGMIPVGQTSASVTVRVVGDLEVEPDETVVLRLGTVANATISDGEAVGTIVGDDRPPPAASRFGEPL